VARCGKKRLTIIAASQLEQMRQSTASLYFRKMKRSRKLWEEELAAFVQVLDNQGSSRR
jgi:hypothetical protein